MAEERLGASFSIDVTNLKAGLNTANKLIRESQSEFKAAAAGMDDWTKSEEGLTAKIKSLNSVADVQRAKVDALQKEYKDLIANGLDPASNQAVTLRTKINEQVAALGKTESEIRKYENSLTELKTSSDSAGTSIKEMSNDVESAGEGFTTLKGTLASLLADGISGVTSGLMEMVGATSQASNQFQAATGASAEAMKGYNKVIEDIYKNNFGESLQDVAQKMAKVKEVTGEIDPSKLQDMTEAAMTLEETFDMDMTETLRGVQSLVTHFGMSAEEAFDLIASGAQNGLNYTDELGDNVSEYAGKFAEAGYSADEYFQLLQNGSDGGAYNLDKVNDAINEVTARLADGTIGDSIDMFTGDTQDLFKAWQNGEATQKQVIDSIVKDIQNTTGEQEKMNMAAKAFGTMAEDGGTMFIQSLTSVGDAFTDTKGKMDEVKQIRYDDVMTSLSGLGRTIKMDIITPVLEDLLPPLKKGLQWIIKHSALVEAGVAAVGTAFVAWKVVSLISGVVKAIKAFQLANEGATVAQWALNTAMNANPIGIIITAIGALVAVFVVLWKKCEGFRNFWKGLWNGITSIVKGAVDGIKAFFSKVIDFFKENWQGILLFIANPFLGAFKLLWDNCEGFRQFWLNLWENIKTVASNAWEFIKGVFSKVEQFFSDVWTGAVNIIKSVFGTLGSFFANAWNTIKSVFSAVGSFFGNAFQGAWNAITNVFSKVGSFFSGIWNTIKGIFTGLGESIGDAIGGAFKSAINGVIKTIENVINGAIDLINDAITLINKIPGVKIGKVSRLNLPKLAKGGVVNSATTAIIGEDGAEAVVPLERNTEWIDKLAEKLSGKAQQAVTINQTNNYSQSHSRYEIYKSKQATAAAVRLAMGGV